MSVYTQSVEQLHKGIVDKEEPEILDILLWEAILAYQNQTFYTLSGLEFSYTVKHKKNGEYSGELQVSRKETSKTLTRSSVMLAFHKVIEATQIRDTNGQAEMILPEYKGPKAIGQIFGISYVYSIFWQFGLIRVPESVQEKLANVQS